jgi:hypothetical protein
MVLPHENLASGSNLLVGDTKTYRQTGDLISLLLFFGKYANNACILLPSFSHFQSSYYRYLMLN